MQFLAKSNATPPRARYVSLSIAKTKDTRHQHEHHNIILIRLTPTDISNTKSTTTNRTKQYLQVVERHTGKDGREQVRL